MLVHYKIRVADVTLYIPLPQSTEGLTREEQIYNYCLDNNIDVDAVYIIENTTKKEYKKLTSSEDHILYKESKLVKQQVHTSESIAKDVEEYQRINGKYSHLSEDELDRRLAEFMK